MLRHRRHDGSHGEECFGCRVQGVQFSPACTPTRTRRVQPTRDPKNSWERGIARDDRGMPIRENGKLIPIKKFSENRRHYERLLDLNRQPTEVLTRT